MLGSLVFAILFFSIPAALLGVPRGSLLHELLHLPRYWWKLYQIDTCHLPLEKISYGDHHRQYLLFIPPQIEVPQPDKIVVYFHGGGWKFGRPEKFKSSILPFYEAGYPVVLPSHRRTPYYNYYDLREDLNQILLAILALQRQRGWTGQRIVLGGMSAGGNLAALLACDHQALADIGVQPAIFAGLLACGAPLALERMQDSLILRAFAGSRESEQFQQANPIEHARKNSPVLPVFCIHGQCDGMVEHQSSTAFIELLKSRRAENIHFFSPPDGTHLEAAAWSHANVALKREILAWLKKL